MCTLMDSLCKLDATVPSADSWMLTMQRATQSLCIARDGMTYTSWPIFPSRASFTMTWLHFGFLKARSAKKLAVRKMRLNFID